MTATFVKNLVGTGAPQFTIGGTDLGIFFDAGRGEYGCLLGDSFQGLPGSPGWWRAPLMLRSSTTDLDSGITFSGVVGGSSPRELIPNAHQAGHIGEVSKIPNDGFLIGDRLYLSAMSINNWDNSWQTNYAALYFSDDFGESWNDSGCRWPNNARYTDVWQMQSFVVDGAYAYLFATSNGRNLYDGLYLARVPVERITDRSAYQTWGFKRTFAWWPWAGSWAWGNPATPILAGVMCEPSVRKIEGTWVYSTLDLGRHAIVTRTAPAPDAPWTSPKIQVTSDQYPRCYGGQIHPASTLDRLHFSVSQWTDTQYHVMQFKGSAL